MAGLHELSAALDVGCTGHDCGHSRRSLDDPHFSISVAAHITLKFGSRIGGQSYKRTNIRQEHSGKRGRRVHQQHRVRVEHA